ncbi:hypothetical protein ACIRVF_11370 [Kitasatospora sp. NPDC101157]
MPAIITTEEPEVTEDATSSLDVAAVDTIQGNVRAFFGQDNTSMMGGWTS